MERGDGMGGGQRRGKRGRVRRGEGTSPGSESSRERKYLGAKVLGTWTYTWSMQCLGIPYTYD